MDKGQVKKLPLSSAAVGITHVKRSFGPSVYPDYKQISDKLFDLLSRRTESEVSFRQIAHDLIVYANGGSEAGRRPDIGSAMAKAKERALETSALESGVARALLVSQIARVFDEVDKQLPSLGRITSIQGEWLGDIERPNPSTFGFGLSAWGDVLGGRLRAGLLEAGGAGDTEFTPYVVYGKEFLRRDYGRLFRFRPRIGVAAALAATLPTDNVKNRYAIFAMLSARLMLGVDAPLFLGIRGRIAAEMEAIVNVGQNDPIGYSIPIRFGAGIGRSLPRGVSLAAGVDSRFFLTQRNAQDINSVSLVFNDFGPFLHLGSPIAGLDVRYGVYGNERTIEARLSHTFRTYLGDITASVEGSSSLSGQPAYPPAAFVRLGWSTSRRKWGIGVEGSFNPSKASFVTDGSSYDNEVTNSLINRAQAFSQEDFAGHEMSCRRGAQRDEPNPHWMCYAGRAFSGEFSDGGEIDCYENSPGRVTCFLGSGDEAIRFNAQFSRDDGVYRFFRISSDWGLSTRNPAVRAFLDSPDLGTFINTVNGFNSVLDKLSALGLLAKLAYMTYDQDGLVTSNGNGNVNSATPDEIFGESRNHLLGLSSQPTTVCRGIAVYIANAAARLGFKAYAAGLATQGMQHVVTIFREPGGNFVVINRGPGYSQTYARTFIEALQFFARQEGYPAERSFTIYDSDGNFVRNIETEGGRVIREALTPPDEFSPYLRFLK